MPDPLMTIGELARRSGFRASAIRYYEDIGVLPTPVRVSGQRRYPDDVLRTLAVVATARRAGLSLPEIRTLLRAEPGDHAAVEALRTIASQKLPEVTALIEHATLVRRWLEAAARCECPTLDDCALFSEPAAACLEKTAPAAGSGAHQRKATIADSPTRTYPIRS